MPTIDIDNDIYTYLQKQAVAFVDTTPNHVLRRLLKISPNHDSASPTASTARTATEGVSSSVTRAQLTSQERYQEVIVQALKEKGGRARTKDVLSRIGEILEDEHTEADLTKYSSGGVRWRARASSEALVLRNEGVLKKEAGHGWWELTDKGETQAGV